MPFTKSYHDYMRTRRFLRKYEPPRKYGYARLVLVSLALFAGVFLLAFIADASIDYQDTDQQEQINCFYDDGMRKCYPPSYNAEND